LSEWHNLINQPNESDELDYNSNELNESFDGLDEFDKLNELNESNNSNKFYESDNPDEFDESNEKLKIISEFMAADMYIQELSITLQELPNVKHTSKFINTQEIAQQYKKRSDQINITAEI
ncbi:13977_t:CDS:1, partial [Racocetra persica]